MRVNGFFSKMFQSWFGSSKFSPFHVLQRAVNLVQLYQARRLEMRVGGISWQVTQVSRCVEPKDVA